MQRFAARHMLRRAFYKLLLDRRLRFLQNPIADRSADPAETAAAPHRNQ